VRKSVLWIVLVVVSVFHLFPAEELEAGATGTAGGSTASAGEEPRIVSSLAEAVSDPPKPLLLVFFALDCPLCWEELFEMKYFVHKHSIPIDLIGVTMDRREELDPFLRKYSFYHPIVSDRQRELYRRFGIRLEPATIIVEDGRILYRDGPVEDFPARKEKIQKCLLQIAAKSPS